MHTNKPNHAHTANVKVGAMEDTSHNLSQTELLVDWLRKVRFKRRLFGGVDEKDVWKKIDELNTFYETALQIERARFRTVETSASEPDQNDLLRTISEVSNAPR